MEEENGILIHTNACSFENPNLFYDNAGARHIASKSANLSACFIVLVYIIDKNASKECVWKWKHIISVKNDRVHENVFLH